MKICFVCSEYPPGPHGGIGTMTQILARALMQAGHEVRVTGIYPRSYPAPDYDVDQGVRVWRLREPGVRGGWILGRIRLFFQIAAWSYRKQIDLVEIPDWQGWVAGWPKLPVPVIVRLNGCATYFASETGTTVTKRRRWLDRESLRRADFVASVSQYTAGRTNQALGLTHEADAVLYNGVEVVPDCAPSARGQKQVVFTGTLTAKKGVVSLIQAWKQVLLAHPNAHLHLYGKDRPEHEGQSMQAFLESLLDERERCRVTFHGHVTRDVLYAAFRQADAAVFPSYTEAFAFAPIEAMSQGCPTIYSRRGSGPELMRAGVDGLLIDPDDPADIAQAIVRLLADPEWAAQIGAAGCQRAAERFTLAALLPQNEAFFRRCMDKFERKSG